MANFALLISWLDKSVLSFLFSGVLTASAFLLEAYCLFVIAKRRGLSKSWLAWIPVLQLWVLGDISDRYQKGFGKRRFMRWSLLTFCLISSLVGSLLSGMLKDLVIEFIRTGVFQWPSLDWFLSAGGLVLITAVLALVLKILQLLALYDLFRSCQPEKAPIYLLISFLISVSTPILLLLCHKKDLGLPTAEPV